MTAPIHTKGPARKPTLSPSLSLRPNGATTHNPRRNGYRLNRRIYKEQEWQADTLA